MVIANAPIHPSVWDRFNGPEVLIYDEVKQYRPKSLKEHEQYREAYLDNWPKRGAQRSRDVIELCGYDRRRHHGEPINGTLGAGEETKCPVA